MPRRMAGGLRNRVSRPPPTEAVVHTPSGLGRNRLFGFDRTLSGCHPATSSNCPPVLPAGKALSDSQIFWGDGTAKPYVDCLPLQHDREGRLLRCRPAALPRESQLTLSL